MRPSHPAPLNHLQDLQLLLKAHYPLILLETSEDERANALLAHLADQTNLPFFTWTRTRGLSRAGIDAAVYQTRTPKECLSHILSNQKLEAIYHLHDFLPYVDEADIVSIFKELHQQFHRHRGAIVLTTDDAKALPGALVQRFATVTLSPPTAAEYHCFLSDIVTDLRQRMTIHVGVDQDDMVELIEHLRGLTLFEVQKIVTTALIETGSFDRSLLPKIFEGKKHIIQQSGVLEYFPATERMTDIAGLDELKKWLRVRRASFLDRAKAKAFGLSAPRGVLLVGVPGCGKSLCAKAVASEWDLPLIRLDPASLYQRYLGDTEKNLKKAISTAEAMAPVVLWIDEIEKAFGQDGDSDGGSSQRVFGTFLSWLQDKKEEVFVVATSNDIKRLPPELLRKGRFDEIFFVDLPDSESRIAIIEIHLRRRDRDPARFDLEALANATDGFSGAELEQAIVSGLYEAYSRSEKLSTEILLQEIAATQPLSQTMGEKIDAIRKWAKGRAVPAD